MILSSSFAATISMNGSCNACLCVMLLDSTTMGLNCVADTMCLFFYNYSTPYNLISSPNSSFRFLILPPEEQPTSAYKTTQEPRITSSITTAIENELTTDAIWSSIGEIVAGAGAIGSGASLLLNAPGPVVFDSDNNMYVNDFGHNRVIIYPSNGATPTTAAGNGVAGSAMDQLNAPNGIGVDSNGTLYVADQNNHRIQQWFPGASSGTTVAGITGISGSSLNQLSSPQSVSVDSVGNMYISDGNNRRILQWPVGASQGVVVAGDGVAGSALSNIAYAYDAQVDSAGHIYVPDFNNGRVLKWTPPSVSGTVIAGQISSPGWNADQLNQPSHVIIDSSGNIYVCDYGTNRIQRWLNGSSSGSTVAGTGTAGSNPDQLNGPYGIAFDMFNNLYIADTNNNRIQRFNLTHP